jgi:hypothetical protein
MIPPYVYICYCNKDRKDKHFYYEIHIKCRLIIIILMKNATLHLPLQIYID